jgi:hypothetical protein
MLSVHTYRGVTRILRCNNALAPDLTLQRVFYSMCSCETIILNWELVIYFLLGLYLCCITVGPWDLLTEYFTMCVHHDVKTNMTLAVGVFQVLARMHIGCMSKVNS